MLCDRNCVIDKKTLNSKLKDEAHSLQLQGNNDACEYWYWASLEDPADGEARIAYQNYPFQLSSQNPCSTPIHSS